MKKKLYNVARNALTISAPEGLKAWELIEPRFRPFEAAGAATPPVLDIVINVGMHPGASSSTGARVYEPEFGGVGFIAGSVVQEADGGMTFCFRHIDEQTPRLIMRMPRELNRAEITLRDNGNGCDSQFLTHTLMLAFMLATCGNGTLLIHSSAILYGGKAYLFQGKSGTGKSTHAWLWTRHIAGAQLLNDDHPVIRFSDDGQRAMAYGSPWSGKTHCYRNLSAPIGAMVRIVRAPVNELRRLDPLRAYASLTASVFHLPVMSEEQRAARHSTIERLVMTTPCCEMHCRPDADAALTCRDRVGMPPPQ